MSDKKSFNPLLLVVGVVAGAVGALVMSDAKMKKKTKGVAARVGTKLKKIAADAKVIHKQRNIDSQKKSAKKKAA